jgi:hypothetical protein
MTNALTLLGELSETPPRGPSPRDPRVCSQMFRVVDRVAGTYPVGLCLEVYKNDARKDEVSKNEVPKDEVSRNEVSKDEVSRNEVSKNEVSKGRGFEARRVRAPAGVSALGEERAASEGRGATIRGTMERDFREVQRSRARSKQS